MKMKIKKIEVRVLVTAEDETPIEELAQLGEALAKYENADKSVYQALVEYFADVEGDPELPLPESNDCPIKVHFDVTTAKLMGGVIQ